MPLKLMIEHFNGPKIAVVSQSQDGQLLIHAFSSEMQGEVESLIQRIGQKPLRLRGGSMQMFDGEMTYVTTMSRVSPGEPDYLRALSDALGKPDCKIQGKRINTYVIEE